MAKKKGLQKVTDLTTINNKTDLEVYIAKHPKKIEELANYLQVKYNEHTGENYNGEKADKYFFLICEMSVITNNTAKLEYWKNLVFERNRMRISGYITNYILENRNFPTVSQIAHESKVSRTTVYKHLKKGIGSDGYDFINKKLQYLTASALEKLYLIGVEDNNATALKIFIELVNKESYKANTINNFIQINNLRLGNEDFQKLPKETLDKIEDLISKVI
jgi:hypothetical protein